MADLGKAVLAAGIAAGAYWFWTEQRTQQAATAAPNLPQSSGRSRRSGFNFAPMLEWATGELMHTFGSNTTTTDRRAVSRRPDSLPGRTSRPPAVSRRPETLPTNTGQRLLGDLMRDFGLTREQAAGVVGNLDHETGGFKFMQEIEPVIPGSLGGYGFAQWTGPRRRDFEAWAAARSLNLSSYTANYGFLKHELTNTSERRVIPKLKQCSTVEQAARVFSQTFLRPGIPHMSSRITRAKKYA